MFSLPFDLTPNQIRELEGLPKRVIIISKNCVKFSVDTIVCLESPVIQTMISNTTFKESKGTIRFVGIDDETLEQVIRFFYHKFLVRDSPSAQPFSFPPELALKVMMAADYLMC
ncbi:hypothetical protein BLNAU_15565 [Blattamonas nauphoetae]|uniref:Elongin-C n=1 Tax=Blattamonas nauphoetae TaxID=2049346 RepID=A0ABQ9XAC2_9EUKA|nr:hypothetical protein BLNAU_15565 [Blattamonas nauphoetae]